MSFHNEKQFELQKLLSRVEYTKLKDGIFKDPKALELVSSLDLSNVKRLDSNKEERYMATTLFLDQMVNDYIIYNSNAAIITVNAGLDTRKTRVDRKNTTWYNLDTEEMKLYKESLGFDNIIANDILDEAWPESINTSCPSVLVILEDYVMYEDKDKVLKILKFLASHFANLTVLIENLSLRLLNKLKGIYDYKNAYTVKEFLSSDDGYEFIKKRSTYRGLEKLYWYKLFTEFLGSNYTEIVMIHKN